MIQKDLDCAYKIASFEKARWRKTARQLRERLSAFADRTEFRTESARAEPMFFENLNYDYLECDDDFINERFYEWFLIDYVAAGGQTLMEIFINRWGHQLSVMESGLLDSWKDSRVSLYEVVDVDFKGAAFVRDLLREGESHWLPTGKNTGRLEKNTVVLMRLIKVGGQYEFSTSGLALPLYVKRHLVTIIQKDYRCQESIIGPGEYDWNDYLKEKAHVINNLVAELGLASTMPNLLTSEGDELVECSAEYEIMDHPDFMEIANTSPYFSVAKNQKKRTPVRVVYYLLGGKNNERVLGELVATKSRALLKCFSKVRLEKGKHVIDALFHDVVQHKKDSYTSVKSRIFKDMVSNLNLAMLEGMEKNLPKDSKKILQGFIDRANEYNWDSCKYVDAAARAMLELSQRGYKERQIDFALFLWHEYCKKERPTIRKPSVWAAVVVYTVARLEFDRNVHQKDLADKFNVSSSTISLRFKDLCRTLQLDFSGRYSFAQRISKKGLDGIKDLLFDIFGTLKI